MDSKSMVKYLFGFSWYVDSLLFRNLYKNNGFISLMFHNIFPNNQSIQDLEGIFSEEITIKDLENILIYMKSIGCTFISINDLEKYQNINMPSVLLTFDDGYRSVLDVVPILEKYDAPAIVFINTNPVINGEMFFWDAVYSYERKSGLNHNDSFRSVEYVKNLIPDIRKEFMLNKYGIEILDIKSNKSRPLNHKELLKLSQHPLVTIGCHTSDHIPLDICNDKNLKNQILKSKNDLEEMTGKKAKAFAYPYGRYNRKIVDYVQSSGFKFGFASSEGFNYFPLKSHFELNRFNPVGYWSIRTQCRYYLSKRWTTKLFHHVLSNYAKVKSYSKISSYLV